MTSLPQWIASHQELSAATAAPIEIRHDDAAESGPWLPRDGYRIAFEVRASTGAEAAAIARERIDEAGGREKAITTTRDGDGVLAYAVFHAPPEWDESCAAYVESELGSNPPPLLEP